MDISDEIDASFGAGPAEGPVHAILADGHRALRRRRLATSGAAALVAVVLGGSAVFAAGGGSDTAGGPDADVAGSPSAAASEKPEPTRKQVSRVLRMQLADYGDDGRLTIDPRARVVQRLDNPYDLAAPGRSAAVALEFRGATYWFVIYRYASGDGGGSSTWSGDSDQSFEDWVDSEQMLSDGTTDVPDGPDAWPGIPDLDLVRFAGAGEVLEPVDGVTIFEQRPSPEVGDAFATADDQSAVAYVGAADGTTYYVLARGLDGSEPEYIAVKGADGGPTLDAFLDLARERYATDGGGLL